MEKYIDRHDAGKVLAKQLRAYAKKTDAIILALPRGGVPVGYEIAKALEIPFDIFIVRKLGVPGYEELAMGAIASGGTMFLNEDIVGYYNIDKATIDKAVQTELKELQRRELKYRNKKAFPILKNKTVILVDDGIATGATIHAAIEGLRKHDAAKIVVAVPVAAYTTCVEISKIVDEFVCPLMPHDFYAVGAWYDNFSQTTDEEVTQLCGTNSEPTSAK